MLRIRRSAALTAASVALLAAPSAAHATIVTNGDFETGNLSGWKTDIPNMPGPRNCFVYTGTTSPLSSNTIPAPPQGTHAAISDQNAISRQILYQDVTLPPGGTVNQLSLIAYYHSLTAITSPDSLDLSLNPNEQYRIDLIKPGAAIDSVASGDVLLNVFRTQTGAPVTLAPTQMAASLTPFAGQTVRLRFAVVTKNAVLNAGADAVSIKSNGFKIGKANLNQNNGTAKLPLTLPDDGTLKA